MEFSEAFEKAETKYWGNPFNEIKNLNSLTPGQREAYLDVKALRDFQGLMKDLDPNKKYKLIFEEQDM